MSNTYDSLTIDSTGAFTISELERLDPTLNEPLVAFTWTRDVDVRNDVSLVDEIASFTLSTFGDVDSTGGWIGKGAGSAGGQLDSVQADINKISQPLSNWGKSVDYSIIDLQRSMQLNRPIDETKISALQLVYNQKVDKLVYLGDTTINTTGLANSASVTPANVATGVGGVTWALKTPMEILTDIEEIQNAAWAASGYAVAPNKLLVAPSSIQELLKPLTIGGVGYASILEYAAKNSLCFQQNGVLLDIQAVKWLETAGAGSVKRMVAYTKDRKYVQYPFAPLQRMQMTFTGISQHIPYVANLGQIEIRYTDTLQYRDAM